MGTDITIFVEYQWNKDDDWESLGEFDHGCIRHYAMFKIMADARDVSGVNPLYGTRGFPPDASISYARKFDDTNDYGQSYLNCTEFQKVLDETHRQCGEVGFIMRVLGDHLLSLKRQGAHDSRIIFWFDS